MIILALNGGRSSLKFHVLACDLGALPRDARRLARGGVERLGDGAFCVFQTEGSFETREREPVRDHEAAVRRGLGWLAAGGASDHGDAIQVDAVGHRVVHGGKRFTQPVLIDTDVLDAIEALEALAPLHNAPSLAGIRADRGALRPRVPMVAVFDNIQLKYEKQIIEALSERRDSGTSETRGEDRSQRRTKLNGKSATVTEPLWQDRERSMATGFSVILEDKPGPTRHCSRWYHGQHRGDPRD